MSTATMTYTGTLRVLTCGECQCQFAMPEDLYRRCQADTSKTFWCPQGHPRVFRESEVQRLERERDRYKRQAEWAETSRKAAQDQADTAEYRRRAAQGQLTKIRKRVASGVCPECHRTFPALASHMEDKHPGFKADESIGTPAQTVAASSSEIRAWARPKRIAVSDRGRLPAWVRERYQREHAG